MENDNIAHTKEETDMENHSDDQLLRQFFSEAARQQISDNGFSRRVMRHLPVRINWIERVWTLCCIAVAVVLFVMFRGWELLAQHLLTLLQPLHDAQPLTLLTTLTTVVFGLLFVGIGEVILSERRLL